MKKVFILLFILFVGGLIATFAKNNNSFSPTQADMLTDSNHIREISNQKFEQICGKIITSFNADKDFINAFNHDKAEFIKHRLIQRNLILPAFDSSNGTAYGSNYEIYSNSYLMELNKQKLNSYKRTLQLYCLYNDFAQPENVCKPEYIEAIFK